MRAVIAAIGQRYYFANWLREANPSIDLLLTNSEPPQGISETGWGFLESPHSSEPSEFISFAKELIGNYRPDIVLSLDEEEALLWAYAFENSGLLPSCLIPDKQSILGTLDKREYYKVLEDMPANLGRLPKLISDFSEIEPSEEYFAKKATGSGSREQRLLKGAELQGMGPSFFDLLKTKGYIFQPRLRGEEFGIDLFCAERGDPDIVQVRRKLAYGETETMMAETVTNTPFLGFCSFLAKKMGLLGIADLDVIVAENNDIYLLDVNCRFGGGYPLSHIAGGNILQAMTEIAARTESIRKPIAKQEEGVTVRKERSQTGFSFFVVN